MSHKLCYELGLVFSYKIYNQIQTILLVWLVYNTGNKPKGLHLHN